LALAHYQLGATVKARAAWSRAQIWHEQHRNGLSKEESKELQGFRAEAEKVLGAVTSATPEGTLK